MIELIRRLFWPKPSVDGIVASFNKTVRRLEAVAADQEAAAVAQAEAAKMALEHEQIAKIEAARARAVASNLTSLVVG